MDKMQLQNAEFDAANRFSKATARLFATPVVDDDYPEVRHGYDSALSGLLAAASANGRRIDVPEPSKAAPQPCEVRAADAVHALVTEWRQRPGITDAYKICATELDSALATTRQDAAKVQRIEPLDLTDAEIAEWLDRHDLAHAIRGRDARAAFEDAQSFHMTKPATTPPPGVDVGKLRELVEDWRDSANVSSERATLVSAGNAVAFAACADALESAIDAAAPGAAAPDDGSDPGEFGCGIQPNPKARYWQGRADFWRGHAVALGYKSHGEDEAAPQPRGVVDEAKARDAFEEWFLAIETGDGTIPVPQSIADGQAWHDHVGRRQIAQGAWFEAIAFAGRVSQGHAPPVTWQSMESAPRDGAAILAMLPDSDMPIVIRHRERSGWHVAWDDHQLGEFDRPVKWMPCPDTAPQPRDVRGVDELADRIADHLCEQEYDIGGRDELRQHIRDALPEGRWIAADDVDRLVRQMDVALNGEAGAAKQAHLCDVAAQVLSHARQRGPLLDAVEFQPRVARWAAECFDAATYGSLTERGDRFLEEVLELLQAHGYDRGRIPTLIDYVYGRPAGEPGQEVGGVMVTLAAFCSVAWLDMVAEGARELARVSDPVVMSRIRAKQEAKRALRFDTPLPGTAGAAGVGAQK